VPSWCPPVCDQPPATLGQRDRGTTTLTVSQQKISLSPGKRLHHQRSSSFHYPLNSAFLDGRCCAVLRLSHSSNHTHRLYANHCPEAFFRSFVLLGWMGGTPNAPRSPARRTPPGHRARRPSPSAPEGGGTGLLSTSNTIVAAGSPADSVSVVALMFPPKPTRSAANATDVTGPAWMSSNPNPNPNPDPKPSSHTNSPAAPRTPRT
jgi:hypothetical protein